MPIGRWKSGVCERHRADEGCVRHPVQPTGPDRSRAVCRARPHQRRMGGEQVMDPDEVLKRLREHTPTILLRDENDPAWDMADLFDALDAWITAGGFIPRAWEENR